MTKFLITTVLIAVAALTGVARAQAGEKFTPETKAVFVTVMAIYDEKCEGDAPSNATLVYNKLVSEQAYTEKQVKAAIRTQAAFIASIGQRNWCRFATALLSKNF
jgi:hypothetical protein